METSLTSSTSHTAMATQESISLPPESTITATSDLTVLTASGRESLLSSIAHQTSVGDLGPGGQFLLPTSGTDGSQAPGEENYTATYQVNQEVKYIILLYMYM